MPITSQRETAGRAWTPGPWQPDHEDLSSKVRAPDGTMIAQVHQYRSGGIGADERKANARLIAAAPELFEALVQAEIAVQELCNDQNPANECWNILRSIRAALSRATATGEVK